MSSTVVSGLVATPGFWIAFIIVFSLLAVAGLVVIVYYHCYRKEPCSGQPDEQPGPLASQA